MLGTGRRYTVIKADGELGSAYADVTAFYEVSFWAPENFGAFVCKQCHREIKRLTQ